MDKGECFEDITGLDTTNVSRDEFENLNKDLRWKLYEDMQELFFGVQAELDDMSDSLNGAIAKYDEVSEPVNKEPEDRRKGRKYKWSVVTQSLKTGNVTVNVFDSKEAAETYHERQKPDTRQWVKRAMHHYDRG